MEVVMIYFYVSGEKLDITFNIHHFCLGLECIAIHYRKIWYILWFFLYSSILRNITELNSSVSKSSKVLGIRV
jgi:hypothetical protein